jgi:hypothetical protein
MANNPFKDYIPAPQARETPVPSAARTTSGVTDPLEGYGQAKYLRAQLNVTSASGTTPSLDVVIEDTVDDGANWNAIGTFSKKDNSKIPTRQVVNITDPFSDVIRIRWTIAGTSPSFTFSVDWIAQ